MDSIQRRNANDPASARSYQEHLRLDGMNISEEDLVSSLPMQECGLN